MTDKDIPEINSYYKCTVCGFLYSGASAPSCCPKCDNDKFRKTAKR
ncbi:MAG: rubredoxin-like domain-containing protein [Christensenellales bacterium]